MAKPAATEGAASAGHASVGPVKRYGALRYEPHTAHSEAYLAGDLENLVKRFGPQPGERVAFSRSIRTA